MIAFKQMDNRVTPAFKTMIKIVGGIFGEEFWDNVIIEATFWGYSIDKIEDRGDLTEDEWLDNIPKRTLNGSVPNVDNLTAIYIDTFYRKSDKVQAEKFIENTEKLFKFATEKKPFHCKDIKSVKHDLRILQDEKDKLEKEKRELEEKRRTLEASCESEKSNLNDSLYSAREVNENLRAQTASLESKNTLMTTKMGHGTNTLVLVSFGLMVAGLILGLGVMSAIKKKNKVTHHIQNIYSKEYVHN